MQTVVWIVRDYGGFFLAAFMFRTDAKEFQENESDCQIYEELISVDTHIKPGT